MTDNAGQSRRRFLSWCSEAVLSLMGLLIVGPAMGYLLSPLYARAKGSSADDENSYIDIGALNKVPVGGWTLLPLVLTEQDGWATSKKKHSVWVRRNSPYPNDINILSPICPHLGCPVAWHKDVSEFICPCHGGTFDANGKHIAGPPPRSMDPLKYKVENGHLMVRWQDFRIGVHDRIPVQV